MINPDLTDSQLLAARNEYIAATSKEQWKATLLASEKGAAESAATVKAVTSSTAHNIAKVAILLRAQALRRAGDAAVRADDAFASYAAHTMDLIDANDIADGGASAEKSLFFATKKFNVLQEAGYCCYLTLLLMFKFCFKIMSLLHI